MINGHAFEAQLRAARMRKFEPEPGVVFSYELPSQFRCAEMATAMRSGDGDALGELLQPLLKEWSGITQATLLGAGVGSGDPAPLSPDVLRITLADRPGWVTQWAMHAIGEASAAAQRLKATTGN